MISLACCAEITYHQNFKFSRAHPEILWGLDRSILFLSQFLHRVPHWARHLGNVSILSPRGRHCLHSRLLLYLQLGLGDHYNWALEAKVFGVGLYMGNIEDDEVGGPKVKLPRSYAGWSCNRSLPASLSLVEDNHKGTEVIANFETNV